MAESPEYMQILREASFDQLLQPLRARVNALQTDILASLTDDDCRTVMTALASGDYVMVDRERFERLLAFAQGWAELPEAFLSLQDHEEAEEGMDLLFKTFQPGDLEPLP